jgi:hypothetical protein
MRFAVLFSALSVFSYGASAATLFPAASITSALGLTPENYYGSPIPPWKPNHHPGWYFGNGPLPQGISCILKGVIICTYSSYADLTFI